MMKNLILSIFFLLSTIYWLAAQEITKDSSVIAVDTLIAEKVVATFNKIYPQIKIEEWVKEGDIYTISFYHDNKWYDVIISANGNWKESFIVIDYDNLPSAIKNKLESEEYIDLEIFKILELDSPSNKSYKIFAERNFEELELLFKEDGSLMKP